MKNSLKHMMRANAQKTGFEIQSAGEQICTLREEVSRFDPPDHETMRWLVDSYEDYTSAFIHTFAYHVMFCQNKDIFIDQMIDEVDCLCEQFDYELGNRGIHKLTHLVANCLMSGYDQNIEDRAEFPVCFALMGSRRLPKVYRVLNGEGTPVRTWTRQWMDKTGEATDLAMSLLSGEREDNRWMEPHAGAALEAYRMNAETSAQLSLYMSMADHLSPAEIPGKKEREDISFLQMQLDSNVEMAKSFLHRWTDLYF